MSVLVLNISALITGLATTASGQRAAGGGQAAAGGRGAGAAGEHAHGQRLHGAPAAAWTRPARARPQAQRSVPLLVTCTTCYRSQTHLSSAAHRQLRCFVSAITPAAAWAHSNATAESGDLSAQLKDTLS